MKIRVGITDQNLRQLRPRGVARVARAVTERLALEGDLEISAISEPFFDMGEMLVKAFPIDPYLEAVPLDLTLPRKKIPRIYYIFAGMGWVALRPWSIRALRSLAIGLGAFERSRDVYRQMNAMRAQMAGASAIDVGAIEAGLPQSVTALDNFDVVLSFEAFETLWEWPLETSRAKAICFIHDTIPLRIYEGQHGRPDHFFRRVGTAILRADHLICNSYSTSKDVEIFYNAGADKLTTAHLGHDIDRFRLLSNSGSGRKSRQRILMVGDIDNRKNLQGMLRALPYIKERLPDRSLELVVVGNSHQRNFFSVLEKAASEYATITWTGYVSDHDLTRYYRETDVFVFPSLWEGFGIPILEAMSAGIPVVCSDLSSMPEVGGKHVKYCDPYDPSSIGQAVADILSMNEDERAQWISAAADWASSFTWDATAAKIADVIRGILDSQMKPERIAP